jgi:hypothetical protein
MFYSLNSVRTKLKKVKLSLCLTKHYAMETYGEVDIYIYMCVCVCVYLTSALVGGEWSASRPRRFAPGDRASSVHWIGGWVDSIPQS